MTAVYRRRRQRERARVEVRRGRGGLALRIDGTFASWHAEDGAVTGTVWEALAAPLLLLPPRRRQAILILGLGGGSAARFVRRLAPRARIVGVERDRAVLRAAERHFGLGELGVEAVAADAREFVARSRRRFDAVIEDVFVGRAGRERKPDWLPEPVLGQALGRLRPGGIAVSNTLDETAAVGRFLARRFPRVLEIGLADYENRVLVGAPAAADARSLRRAVAEDPVLAPALDALSFRSRPG